MNTLVLAIDIELGKYNSILRMNGAISYPVFLCSRRRGIDNEFLSIFVLFIWKFIYINSQISYIYNQCLLTYTATVSISTALFP